MPAGENPVIPPAPGPDQPKTAFRAWARGRLRAPEADPSTPAGAAASQAACEAAWPLLGLRPAGILLLYVPIRGELNPIFLASAAIQAGWSIALPRCDSRTGTPLLYAMPASALLPGLPAPTWDPAALEPDAWDVPAPKARTPVLASAISAVVVPGLAFDPTGGRLGRGAGIYDRLLAALPPTAYRIGLITDDRVVTALPHEPHDVKMHAIVTPQSGVILRH